MIPAIAFLMCGALSAWIAFWVGHAYGYEKGRDDTIAKQRGTDGPA